MKRVLIVGAVLALLAGVVVAGAAAWRHLSRTPFEASLSAVDAGALRVSFTDWGTVREELDPKDHETVDEWVDRGYETDLTSGSSINESAAALEEHFGFSPDDMDWEVFFQGRDGAAMVVRVDVSFDDVRNALTDSGFTEPKKDGDVWSGGVDLIASLDPTLTPQVQYVALLEDEGLIITSDTREYAAQVVDVVRGDKDSLADRGDAAELVGQVGEPETAVLWAGDFACEDLSLANGGEEAQQEGEQLIAQAGGITPVTGAVMALTDDRLTVGLQFEDSDEAQENLRPRAELAVGPAVGRGPNAFSDDMELVSSRASGSTVLLEFDPRNDTFPLSRLYSGAVIFASC